MSTPDIDAITASFCKSLDNAVWADAPYRHCIIRDVFPDGVLAALQHIDFPVAELGGVSGSREIHNDTRRYFNAATISASPVIANIATALHGPAAAAKVAETFDADIDGTLLRLEYAQDINGFWLQPHTDLGVKKFTMLIYLSDGADHDTLGTDIYADQNTWAKRTPFAPNVALCFKPDDHTWHGIERREIKGVRKSLIFNYVTTAWRDREQLAYPDQPVRVG